MSTEKNTNQKKITAVDVQNAKGRDKLVAVTCYDATFAKLLDADSDILLVGDSLGMVIQGGDDTLSVTLEEVIYHSKAVARGRKRAHLVADMPFLTYQVGNRSAIKNAGRLLSEGRAEAVKIEGGVPSAKAIRAIVDQGIPVMGHVGLTPQSVHRMGGYKIQGKTPAARKTLMQDALAVQDAGAYSLVLEGIPADLAAEITAKLTIPTIGIGAGKECDGQILVCYDLLGMNPDFSPRFVKKFSELHRNVGQAVGQYSREVREGIFPSKEHSF